MKEFADELRASREAKRVSLTDISSATKIHPKYLRMMEEGNYSFLPETYIRAFVRDYAKALDLDPDEIMQRFDSAREKSQSLKETRPSERKASPTRVPPEKEMPTPPRGILYSLWLMLKDVWREQTSRRKYLPAAVLLVLVLIVVLIANVTKTSRDDATQEIPFDQILREKENGSLAHGDSAAALGASTPVSITSGDSLILEGTTTQEVWVRLLVDDTQPKEYLFQPMKVLTWKAKEKFQVSLGNAGGISFKLNGRELGMLGKQGAVVKDIVINRHGVQK